METTFATLKNRIGPGVIRYRGILKTKAQVLPAAVAFNMRPLGDIADANKASPRLKSTQTALETTKKPASNRGG